MSKIYLKYIPIHIYNFEHIMNIKLFSHIFLFHKNINGGGGGGTNIPLINQLIKI